MTEAKLASLMRSNRPSFVMPALDTSTSTGPNFASTAVNAASTLSLEVTSHDTPNSRRAEVTSCT